MSIIGENIKQLREARGWSKAELSRMIGKSRAAVSQYESGNTTPRMGAIEDLARAFGVNKRDIIEPRINYALISIPDDLTDDEILLIKAFRKLDAHSKHAIMAGLKDYLGGCDED